MRAVIFDFNGTLFDDTDFHRAAWKRFMKERFGMDLSAEEIEKYYIGPDNRMIFRRVCGDDLPETEMLKLSEEKERLYREAVMSDPKNTSLVEGAAELLDKLKATGTPFAVATASMRANVRFYMDELGLKRWLDERLIVNAQDGLRGKPAPDMYIEAARRLHRDVRACVIAEDSKTGIEAARRAQAWRIIAIDRTTPKKWLQEQKEIYAVIHDFIGFERYLENTAK